MCLVEVVVKVVVVVVVVASTYGRAQTIGFEEESHPSN